MPTTYRVILHGDPKTDPSFCGLNWNRAVRIVDVIRRLGAEATIQPDQSDGSQDDQPDSMTSTE